MTWKYSFMILNNLNTNMVSIVMYIWWKIYKVIISFLVQQFLEKENLIYRDSPTLAFASDFFRNGLFPSPYSASEEFSNLTSNLRRYSLFFVDSLLSYTEESRCSPYCLLPRVVTLRIVYSRGYKCMNYVQAAF